MAVRILYQDIPKRVPVSPEEEERDGLLAHLVSSDRVSDPVQLKENLAAFDLHVLTQTALLYSDEMNEDLIHALTQSLALIKDPSIRASVVSQMLSLYSDRSKIPACDRAELVECFSKIPPEKLCAVTEQMSRMNIKTTESYYISQLVSKLLSMGAKMEAVVTQAIRLLSLDGGDLGEIFEICSSFGDEDLEKCISQILTLTKPIEKQFNFLGIAGQLKGLSSEDRALLVKCASQCVTKEMNGSEICSILRSLQMTASGNWGRVTEQMERIIKSKKGFSYVYTSPFIDELIKIPVNAVMKVVDTFLVLQEPGMDVSDFQKPLEEALSILIPLDEVWGMGNYVIKGPNEEEVIKRNFFRLMRNHMPLEDRARLFAYLDGFPLDTDMDGFVTQTLPFMHWMMEWDEKFAILEKLRPVSPEYLRKAIDKWPLDKMSVVEKAVILDPLIFAYLKGVEVERVACWFEPCSDLAVLRSRFCHKNPLLETLSKDLRWRLGIDLRYQKQGPNVFDQELSRGFRRGMERGWPFLDKIRDSRMNAFLLQALHDLLVAGVDNRDFPLKSGYDAGWHYGFKKSEITDQAQLLKEWESDKLILTSSREQELRKEIEKQFAGQDPSIIVKEYDAARKQYLATLKWNGSSAIIYSQFSKGDEDRIDAILTQFYQEANGATTQREGYKAIARCCRALMIFHAFPDANGRTISFGLCTFLLNQVRSPLALIDPFLFNGTQTIEQMAEQIEIGVRKYESVKLAVMIGESSGHTPIDRDADNYSTLLETYGPLFKMMLRVQPKL